MFWYQIIILAIIQGLTEFLPISSSGHLVVLPHLLEWQDQGHLMDVAVHVGTLGAILLYFWRDVMGMMTGVFALGRGKITKGGKLFLLLCAGTIPPVILGTILSAYGMEKFRSVSLIGSTMVGYGILLYLADKVGSLNKKEGDITGLQALWVGVAQALALIPGTSRSGACMTMMRFLGFNRVEAARFSFLLAIPSIFAAGTLTFFKAIKAAGIATISSDVLLGIGVSFVASLGAINFMLKWLRQRDFTPFVIYRLIFGGGLLMWAYFF